MLPYQERVVEEKLELSEKIVKLDAFLKSPVLSKCSADEQVRLTLQLTIMLQYEQVLTERINNFK